MAKMDIGKKRSDLGLPSLEKRTSGKYEPLKQSRRQQSLMYEFNKKESNETA